MLNMNSHSKKVAASFTAIVFFSLFNCLLAKQKLDPQPQHHETDIKVEEIPSPLTKDNDELQPKENSIELNQNDGLCKPAVTEPDPPDSSGKCLVSSASTGFLVMFSLGVLLLCVAVGGAGYLLGKRKRQNSDLEEANERIEEEPLNKKQKEQKETITRLEEESDKDNELKAAQTRLMDVKNELENQLNKTRQSLEEVEREKEKNKKNLQAVEDEIVKREETLDKPEELLKQKENLLQDKWKLDQIKKDRERQILMLERLMETIEMQTAGEH